MDSLGSEKGKGVQSDDRNDSNHCLTSGIRHSPLEWQRPQQLLPFTAAAVSDMLTTYTLCNAVALLVLLYLSSSIFSFYPASPAIRVHPCSFPHSPVSLSPFLDPRTHDLPTYYTLLYIIYI